ncbi:MAG: hypothetical protein VX730_08125 [Pseudomonadota bacterium]|nr:hypothetical protein [Pseudomonadota bacterium]
MRLFAIVCMCCALFVSVAAVSQTRAGEGLSRQLQSVKSMLESFRSHIDGEIARVDSEINTVDSRVDAANTRMDTMDGRMDGIDTQIGGLNSSINSHDNRITALENGETGVQVYRNCAQRNVTWGSGNCRGTQGPIPHGTSITVRDTVQGDICTNRYQYVGYAVYSCNDGVVTRNGQACQRTDFYNENLCESGSGGDSYANCQGTTRTWSETYNGLTSTCSGSIGSVPHGTTATATDPRTGCDRRDFTGGSSTWLCDNGTLRRQGTATCRTWGSWGSDCR